MLFPVILTFYMHIYRDEKRQIRAFVDSANEHIHIAPLKVLAVTVMGLITIKTTLAHMYSAPFATFMRARSLAIRHSLQLPFQDHTNGFWKVYCPQ